MIVDTTVRFSVPSPDATAAFLLEALEFQVVSHGLGYRQVSNGAISIALVEGSGQAHSLELQCDNIQDEVARILKLSGTLEKPSKHTRSDRIERTVESSTGISLVLYQQLTEDDFEELPALPASLPWDSDADTLARELLRLVPVWVRPSARKRVTDVAEYLAVEAGVLCVSIETCLVAFVDCTLPSQRDGLNQELERRGIDPTRYSGEPSC